MMILRRSRFTRVYDINGTEIRCFRFYSKDKGIIFTHAFGYLLEYDPNYSLEVPDLKRRLLKDDMTSKGGNFYVKHKNIGKSEEWMSGSNCYDVYIDIDSKEVDFEFVGEKKDFEYITERTYKNCYNVSFCGKTYYLEDHCVRREAKSCKKECDSFKKFIKEKIGFDNDYIVEKIYFALSNEKNEFHLAKPKGQCVIDSI